MSIQYEEKNWTPTVWKNRKKPFLSIEVILASAAVILGIVNIIYWNAELHLSYIIILLVGAIYTLRGIESLTSEKSDKGSLVFGVLLCIVAIVSLIRALSI